MNDDRGQLALWIMLTLFVILLVVSPVAAAPAAQATATPTAAYSEDVTLSSGRVMQVQRTFSLGEGATFLAVMAILLVDLALLVSGQVTRWTR